MKPVAVATGILLCASPAFAQAVQAPPVIDMHQHAIPATFWGEPDPDWFPKHVTQAEGDLLEQTLAVMREYNIVKVALSGPVEWVDRWYAADTDRFIRGSNFAAPCIPERVEQLRELHASGGYQIMGEISWQWQGIALNDPQVEPCFALAEELDIPMGIHVGLGYPGAPYASRYRAAVGRPLVLEEMLVRHPNARVYLMHAGWPLLDETIALMYTHPQVYADISFINWYLPREAFYSYLRRLVEAGLGDRLMYGSDAGVWPDAIRLSIEAVATADFLTEQQKRDIFYNNAIRFLRMVLPSN